MFEFVLVYYVAVSVVVCLCACVLVCLFPLVFMSRLTLNVFFFVTTLFEFFLFHLPTFNFLVATFL